VTGNSGIGAPSGANSGNGSADLVYQIEVTAPGGNNTPVSVDVSYLVTTAGQLLGTVGNDVTGDIGTLASLAVGPNAIATVGINLSDFGGSSEYGFSPSYSDTSQNASCTGEVCSGTLSGEQTITLSTNLAYNVVLRAQAGCTAQSPGNTGLTCTSSAMVDPIFTIDPGQSNGSQYAIDLSSGVGNGSAAPEPGSLVTIGGGLLGVAALARRRGSMRW
jgi:hypothetical protein